MKFPLQSFFSFFSSFFRLFLLLFLTKNVFTTNVVVPVVVHSLDKWEVRTTTALLKRTVWYSLN